MYHHHRSQTLTQRVRRTHLWSHFCRTAEKTSCRGPTTELGIKTRRDLRAHQRITNSSAYHTPGDVYTHALTAPTCGHTPFVKPFRADQGWVTRLSPTANRLYAGLAPPYLHTCAYQRKPCLYRLRTDILYWALTTGAPAVSQAHSHIAQVSSFRQGWGGP